MDDFPFTIVGFDLDGTLLDSSGDLAAAVNHALAGAGRPALPVDQITPMIGGGARQMLSHALAAGGGCDDALLDSALPNLLDFYAANIDVHTRPFPGALAALDALAARGVTLGIVTNKRESFTLPLLDRLGLTHRFAAIIGGDTLRTAKPAPEPILEMIARCGGGRAAFVGDSIYDVGAARAADIPVVACAFGFLDRPPEALGADAVIAHYDDLIPTLATL